MPETDQSPRPGVSTERDGAILIVRLDREDVHNSLDPDSMVLLRHTLEDFRDDDSLAVAILTGAGTRAFCAGSDLRRTPPDGSPFAKALLEPWEQGVRNGGYVRAITLNEIGVGKPLIAAINGHAAGGGLEIALNCDLRIASTNATFSLPEARWASLPAVGGLSLLLRAIPPAVAMKMVLTGERIGAAEAHRVGLVSDVYEPEQLLGAARELAHRIAANGPLSVRAMTQLARRSYELPLSQAIAMEQAMWGLLRDTDDRAEGRRAFGERRSPKYGGQ
ncbi:enoyl-CoA hydratase [Streptomyces canus]|uniref:Enoyl-CoA hydratase n=1 Tax=Streptomyces canus TaxID=58343 RepID=A0A117QVV1_9ACTN|nr:MULTISPECIES: enoyl-CoA hydratase-related protein [Streptomyces]KUN54920.1 enoyl-CoA hydratase [Streptomyces canus]MDI5906479.1 enoyl-CoA hydratase-related protein [Streptomyces sp. 12257]